jgi:hypothetical protein
VTMASDLVLMDEKVDTFLTTGGVAAPMDL